MDDYYKFLWDHLRRKFSSGEWSQRSVSGEIASEATALAFAIELRLSLSYDYKRNMYDFINRPIIKKETTLEFRFIYSI